jgi:hypothetical protein
MKRQKHYIVRTTNRDGLNSEIALPHGEPHSFTEALQSARLSTFIYGTDSAVLLVTPRGRGGRVTCLQKFGAQG